VTGEAWHEIVRQRLGVITQRQISNEQGELQGPCQRVYRWRGPCGIKSSWFLPGNAFDFHPLWTTIPNIYPGPLKSTTVTDRKNSIFGF